MTSVTARLRATCETSIKALSDSKNVATAWNKTFATADAIEAEALFRGALDEYCLRAWEAAVSNLKQGGDADARYIPPVYSVRAKVLETGLAAVLDGNSPTAIEAAIDCWDHVDAKVTKLVARSGGTFVSRWPMTKCFAQLDRSWVDGEPTLTTDETHQILTVPSFQDASRSARLEQLIRDCGYSVQRHGIPVEHDLTSLKLIANYQVQDMGSFSIDLEPGDRGPFDVQLPEGLDELLDRLELELALAAPVLVANQDSGSSSDDQDYKLIPTKELCGAIKRSANSDVMEKRLKELGIKYKPTPKGQHGWLIWKEDLQKIGLN